MKNISVVGKEMLAFQEELARERGYEPVGYDFFLGDVRDKYRKHLPTWCVLEGDNNAALYSLDDTPICVGYERIVIGDYGAFVEITPENICRSSLCCKQGQEYRYSDKRFSGNVKYLWLTARDESNCKVYLQQKRVDYADYVPGMYYISPYEVYKR